MTEETAPVALITGASRGIGAGLADFFVAHGYRVFGCSRTAPSAAIGYEHRVVDVTDETAVASLVADIGRDHGRLDILVNNAGIGRSALALASSLEDAEAMIRVNLLGTFLASREAAKLMMRRRSGRIINVASVAVPLRMEGAAIYSASKAAIIQFTKVLARELASFGITCNVIAPSLVESDMMRALGRKGVDRYLERLTIPRVARIEDVCNATWFFASPDSDYVTGQVLYLGLAD